MNSYMFAASTIRRVDRDNSSIDGRCSSMVILGPRVDFSYSDTLCAWGLACMEVYGLDLRVMGLLQCDGTWLLVSPGLLDGDASSYGPN